jgi:hypothetical protein
VIRGLAQEVWALRKMGYFRIGSPGQAALAWHGKFDSLRAEAERLNREARIGEHVESISHGEAA